MKSRLLQLAFVVSVLFNLAAIGAVVYGLSSSKTSAGNKPNALAVYDRLNLTEEQKKIWEVQYFEVIQRVSDSHKRYKVTWLEIVELMSQPKPDWDAVRAKQQEILNLNRETQTMIFQRWDGVRAYMTPDQQKIFFDILQERFKSGEIWGEIKTAQEILNRQTPKP
ncbi:MAG TPA: periplasmic heavy metal sensor [Blastocatellia bacterium]|nr:periplasmic heavy metal sensor [Blastocatellia bacterium]HMY74589.1 periplasmic heavy metal sensor [Blastocatellia bacterium]HNG32719.1 periplasmic heavy metal sensor [Blastocatellia bacterium]